MPHLIPPHPSVRQIQGRILPGNLALRHVTALACYLQGGLWQDPAGVTVGCGGSWDVRDARHLAAGDTR